MTAPTTHDASGHDAHDDADAVFKNAFDAEGQQQLLQEDSEAWHNVMAELLTIVTIGVAFFTFIVWIISR